MARLRLVVWNEAEAKQRGEALSALGHDVDWREVPGPELLPSLRRSLPEAILIDFGRLPSKGHWLALAVRSSKVLRPIPLVLIGGEPAKMARIREVLPDAAYCSWENLGRTLERVLKAPPRNPVAAKTSISTGAPLNQKLGLKDGIRVRLIDPPTSFLKLTGLTDEDVEKPGLTICFVSSLPELEAQIEELARSAPVWIAWPKQGTRPASGLTMYSVREIAFAFGLVDYKICAIDKTWAAMLFTRRKVNRK